MQRMLTIITAVTSAALALFAATPQASAAVVPTTTNASCTYMVQSGDTLNLIAGRLGISWTTLYQMNQGIIGGNPDVIIPGQQFSTCGGVAHSPRPAPPTRTYSPAQPASGSVQGMIQQVFGPYAGGALAVARCESGYDPSAYNSTPVYGNGRMLGHAMGVFQIINATWASTSYAADSPFNAWDNINAAHEIFVRDGYSWREWQCQP
jgi:LysM repeat protein